MSPTPDTPMLDKMAANREKSQAIGEFLDWAALKGLTLGYGHEHAETCYQPHVHKNCWSKCALERDNICGIVLGQHLLAPQNLETLLAEFFGIDPRKAEDERRAILASLHQK